MSGHKKLKSYFREVYSYKLLFLFFVVVIGLWFISYIMLKDIDSNKRGTFGDMFGGVNALFTGLAFAGVMYTILLQKKELRETREEFKIQNETLRRQRFENTFFQMVNLHHEIVTRLSHLGNEGRVVLHTGHTELSGILTNNHHLHFKGKLHLINDFSEHRLVIDKSYLDSFYPRYHYAFSHYFRNLYHIFKLIYISPLIAPSDKQYYATLVRAQLSPDELYLIFYNSLMEDLGSPKFLFLIREFNILKNMDTSMFTHNTHLLIHKIEMEKVENPFV